MWKRWRGVKNRIHTIVCSLVQVVILRMSAVSVKIKIVLLAVYRQIASNIRSIAPDCACWAFLTICCLLVSCRPSSTGRQDSFCDAHELRVLEKLFSSDTVLNLRTYYLSSACVAETGVLLYAYNQKMHALDCFHMADSMVSTQPLTLDGPSGITRPLRGLYAHTPDSIWVLDGAGRALLINAQARVLRSVNLREGLEQGQDLLVESNYALCTSRLHYDARHRSLLYGVKDFNEKPATFRVRELYLDGTKPAATYALRASVSLPDVSGGDYANLGEVNITYAGDDILYNYPAESHVYVLNRATRAEKVVEADSRHTPNAAEPCTSKSDYSAWIRHGLENPHFYEVSYLPSLRLYARLHLAPGAFDATEKDLDKLQNARQMYLMLFDDDFKVVDELALPLHRYSYYTAWTMMPDAILWFVDKGDTADQEEEESCVIAVIVPMK